MPQLPVVIIYFSQFHFLFLCPFLHVERRRLLLIPDQIMRFMGEIVWGSLVESSRNAILHPSDPRVKRVRHIAEKLIEVAGIKDSYEWEFIVIESDEANAFVLPNGKVVVYTGILRTFKNEDQCALVLGHEIAHVLASHKNEDMSFFVLVLSLGYMNYPIIPKSALTYIFELPLSRKLELEADIIGLDLMTRACFKVDNVLHYWSDMDMNAPHSDSVYGAIGSTHPLNSKREELIKSQASKLNVLRQTCGCNEGTFNVWDYVFSKKK
eukprot:TRINITY_DN2447_c0_g1_i1.p1 TRINITY_DN2447_c0_g1~~TRINITY_DN2447_c0_g1_i1.p1  ORF type:complete len:267 (-),score=9.41 TRINITY_DN2447_c0_g1_i1:28-828(-)